MFFAAHPRVAVAARRRHAVLVIVSVLALLVDPALNALRNECDLCPPNCPMHQRSTGSGPRLGCHCRAAPAMHVGQPGTPTGVASLAFAACDHGVSAHISLPPMLMPAAQTLSAPAAMGAPRLGDAALSGRVPDPPDTPPPIGAA